VVVLLVVLLIVLLVVSLVVFVGCLHKLSPLSLEIMNISAGACVLSETSYRRLGEVPPASVAARARASERG
jgi:hypothetical protein